MPSPEELALEKIDKLLTACGWILQNRSTINLSAGQGIAIREALLQGREEVDYLLFVDGKDSGSIDREHLEADNVLGPIYKAFGEKLWPLMDELNPTLAA